MIIVTYKFSRKNLLILGHNKYTIKEWVTILVIILLLCN